jgi:hypothetical protein
MSGITSRIFFVWDLRAKIYVFSFSFWIIKEKDGVGPGNFVGPHLNDKCSCYNYFVLMPKGHFHESTRCLYNWSAESGECATMGRFHLDLRAAVTVAAVEFSIPYLYVTNVIVLATLIGKGNVWTLGVGAGHWSTIRRLVLILHLERCRQDGVLRVALV